MPLIEAVITKCNSQYKNEEEFLLDDRLYGLSFCGNKVLDVIIDPTPILKQKNIKNQENFSHLDLSKGINHYSAKLCFETLEKIQKVSNIGSFFKICEGVNIQFVAIDAEEQINFNDVEIIFK